jgi:hypothetical protein
LTVSLRIRLAKMVLACIASTACAGSEPALDDPATTLVGTWRILRHAPAAGAGDSASLRFGSRPRGYLVYDATGHVFLQIQDVVLADSVKSRWRSAPDSLLRGLLHGFQAYFGTYAVDSAAQLVTHRIEGELLPRFGTVEVATPYRLRGDSLILGADSREQWHFVRVR